MSTTTQSIPTTTTATVELRRERVFYEGCEQFGNFLYVNGERVKLDGNVDPVKLFEKIQESGK